MRQIDGLFPKMHDEQRVAWIRYLDGDIPLPEEIQMQLKIDSTHVDVVVEQVRILPSSECLRNPGRKADEFTPLRVHAPNRT